MRIGIIFGGFSREREVSFAGGRTVYDNLNKSLFEAVPLFVDSFGNFALLDWQYIYKGSIRDFYPSPDLVPPARPEFQIYAESLGDLSSESQEELLLKIGRPVKAEELKELIDFAFLTLHGPFGEDGRIQGLLEWLEIPYSGSGIYSSAIGINKVLQKQLMKVRGFDIPAWFSFTQPDWLHGSREALFSKCRQTIGFPMVIKPAHQGSSIGISILKEDDLDAFSAAVNTAFFIKKVSIQEWNRGGESLVRELADFRQDLGLPLSINDKTFYHPAGLFMYMQEHFASSSASLELVGLDTEYEVLVESFISGKEFSCIVLEDEQGRPLALPPTEIRKTQELYSYRSKYLPGLSRKITPIELSDALIRNICQRCEALYTALSFDVYARIDGFITDEGQIFLNDPNTTSGMMPSSFFFHQAAEIGLNPSQFLTYIISTSLKARTRQQSRRAGYVEKSALLDKMLDTMHSRGEERRKVAVLLGGYSSERHISAESGRNVYEKLSSSGKYEPIPVFLTGDAHKFRMFRIPVNVLLKDNADDMKEKILHFQIHPVVQEIITRGAGIIQRFSEPESLLPPREWDFDQLAMHADMVFIALHGRPGEDGEVQMELEKRGIPYNGSGTASSRLTIDKFATNELLHREGIMVAAHRLVTKAEWETSSEQLVLAIEKEFGYPLIAKPCDDGCSSAVKKINDRSQLHAYCMLLFRSSADLQPTFAGLLDLQTDEEFPVKEVLLIEELITSRGASRFMEITGGMLTHFDAGGMLTYEVFEPSEALSSGEVLSLEEKFLAGEGQNMTPPRYSADKEAQALISAFVKAELERTASILNIRGYCRIDAFVRIYSPQHVEVIIIEANSLPGMTPATAIFHQAALSGYKPFEFIDQVLQFGQKNLSQATHA